MLKVKKKFSNFGTEVGELVMVMYEDNLTAIIGLIGMIITGLFGYLTAKHKVKKDITINDRKLLSEDEKQFRKELREELLRNREEINHLRKEVETLRRMNINLEMENKQLQAKIDELRAELKRWELSAKRRI